MNTALDIQIAPEVIGAPSARSLQASLEGCLAALARVIPNGSQPKLSQAICLRLCAETESQELNHTYRGQDKPTNVLSFGIQENSTPLLDMPAQELPLGDLALCWPVAVEEAQRQSKELDHHVSHLFLHGVLHLLGFDHEGAEEAETMEQIEIQALGLLGIADPYIERGGKGS
jgi:probable rRNA maturation factor